MRLPKTELFNRHEHVKKSLENMKRRKLAMQISQSRPNQYSIYIPLFYQTKLLKLVLPIHRGRVPQIVGNDRLPIFFRKQRKERLMMEYPKFVARVGARHAHFHANDRTCQRPAVQTSSANYGKRSQRATIFSASVRSDRRNTTGS